MSSNIEVKLDVLNQKASPALYAASLANRPAASFTGRLFVDSDSPSTGIYRDTGTTWVQVADQGAGTTGTLQQVTTNGSSTTVGISTSGNGIGIGTTIPASNRLDIHSSSGINATFNGTGTTNASLQFQLAGTGKWNLGNLYNSAANDFIITDVVNTLNRVTVKNTGQTFIGADTTSSGLFVVNNASSDSHIVVLGANSPSIRIRDSGSSLVQNVGLGISTGTNAFIQGSASGNYCIFNSSTTASPILFGVYDAGTGNTQEAIRISAARNLLVGTATDSGYKVSVSGTTNITGVLTLGSTISNGTYTYTLPSATGTLAIVSQFSGYLPLSGGNLTGALTVSVVSGENLTLEKSTGAYLSFKNGSTLRGSINGNNGTDGLNFNYGAAHTTALTINSTGNVGIAENSPSSKLSIGSTVSSTISNNVGLLIGNVGAAASVGNVIQLGFHYNPAGTTPASVIGAILTQTTGYTKSDIFFATRNVNTDTAATEQMRLTGSGNLLIGTTTDAGYKLDVNGTGRFIQGVIASVGAAISSIQVRNESTDQPFIGFYRGGTLRNTLQLLTDGSFKLTDSSLVANAGLTMGTLAIGNSVAAAVAAPSTHKVSILINGVQYYLLASNI